MLVAPKVPKKPAMTTKGAVKLAKPVAKKAVKAAKAAPKTLYADTQSPSKKVSVLTPNPPTSTDNNPMQMMTDLFNSGKSFEDIVRSFPSNIQNGMTGSSSVIDLDRDHI
jgi:hypothetical protein